jgi:hypothetical protein
VYALVERPDRAHAPACLGRSFGNELRLGHLQAVDIIIPLKNGRVLIWINPGLWASASVSAAITAQPI